MASKNTMKDKEREFMLECIELYRNLPALWQIKNKLYHDRSKKNKAYELLLTKYKEMFPQATKDDLKKKFNSLRTNYRKELKKCENFVKSGASTDSTYVSTLWYFQEMSFLRNQELPIDSESSMDTYKITTANGDEDNEEQNSETQSSIEDIQDSLSRNSSHTTNIYAFKKTRKNRQLINLTNKVKDEYHHWGMACAADLRKMNKIQQIYAKKAIAEVIMEGQLGLLHRHSVKVNEQPPSNSAGRFGVWHSPQYHNQTVSPPSYNNSSPSYRTPSSPPVFVNQLPVQVTTKPALPPPNININSIPSPPYK